MKKREYEIQLKEADIEEKMKILAEEKSKFGEKKKKIGSCSEEKQGKEESWEKEVKEKFCKVEERNWKLIYNEMDPVKNKQWSWH